MKKIIVLIIVLGIIFTSNKTFAVFAGPISCGGKTYPHSNDVGYKQCIEAETRKAQEVKEQIYRERVAEISQYSDFFIKVGVNLTLDTSSEQYTKWLEQLREEKNDYLKAQEDQERIRELEERINTLESKQAVVEKVILPTEGINTRNKEGVINQKINDNKIIKTVSKKESVEEKTQPVIDPPIISETPVIKTEKAPFFKRMVNWFKSLL